MTPSVPRYDVLVADDSPVYRQLISEILAGPQYALSFACDGQEALRKFQGNPPQILATDWMLPNFSSLQICRHIRADKSAPYTYIVLMPSQTEKEGVVNVRKARADDHHRTPF